MAGEVKKVKPEKEKDKDKVVLGCILVGGAIAGLIAFLRRTDDQDEDENGNGDGDGVSEYTDMSGYIRDSQTLEPISEVVVEVVGVTSTQTNENGRYTIRGVPNGSYPVTFSHPDYETVELS